VAATRELSAATVGEITAGFRAHAEEQARRLGDVAPWLAARVHPVILGGPPAEAILASAEARGAGLIALGTRGRSGLRRWMLGSVALRLIQTASCPVLTLGPEAQAEDDRVLGS
jgi:nucleotide-binding universal stress UspA family protein